MRGEDDLDDKLLHVMGDEAVSYLSAFEWCERIHDKYFADGFGGIVALFLFRVSIRNAQEPEWIWVIVGDLPTASRIEGFSQREDGARTIHRRRRELGMYA